MVKELLESLLEELGKVIEISTLRPDQNRSCLITFPDGLQVQIELDPQGTSIIIGCDLGSAPPGRYRENVFREALKTNNLPPPHNGILAFSQKSDHLILFENLPTKDLTGEKIADALEPFNEKARKWKDALLRGDIPTVSNIRTSSGMFGLR